MAVIYGASVAQSAQNPVNVLYDIIGKNSAAFTVGDPITQTMATNNLAAGTNVAPGYIPVDNDTLFLMGVNTDLTNTATNFGNYCALTANTTGTVQVDGSNVAQTTSNRVVAIQVVDPFNEGGTGSGSGLRTVLVRFVKTPYTNVTITA